MFSFIGIAIAVVMVSFHRKKKKKKPNYDVGKSQDCKIPKKLGKQHEGVHKT